MAGWLEGLVVAVIGGGGVAIAAGLYKLGVALGDIDSTLEDLDRRVENLERAQGPRGWR
jgi:hypothetical protein